MTSPSISFRISTDYGKRLKEAAAKRGQSSGQYALSLVVAALEDEEREQMRDEIRQLREEVRRVREDLATITTVLLSRTGPVSVDDAKKWVKQNLM